MSDFNVNKCNINIAGTPSHQCKRNRKSGCVILVNGELVYTCTQHYNTYKDAIDAPVYHFTGIMPIVPKEEDTMDTTTTTIIEGLTAAIEYAKKTGFHGVLPKIPGTHNYEFPEKETKVNTNKKQIKCGYCHEYHDTLDAIAACGGKTRIAGAELRKNIPFFTAWQNSSKTRWFGTFWFPTKDEAEECRAFYGVDTFTQAKNKHGYKVVIARHLASLKGDFKGMIAAYKAKKS